MSICFFGEEWCSIGGVSIIFKRLPDILIANAPTANEYASHVDPTRKKSRNYATCGRTWAATAATDDRLLD